MRETSTATISDHARRASLAGAVVAAIAASACCLVPAVLAVIGVSGVGFAAALEPYRPVFLGAAVVALATGFYFTYRRPPIRNGIACACDQPRPRAKRAARSLLWLATIGVAVLAAYPYLAAIGVRDHVVGASLPVSGSMTRWIEIDGMTCEGCTEEIAGALAALDGVSESRVDFAGRRASVTYDPARVTPTQLIHAVEELGYEARLESPSLFP